MTWISAPEEATGGKHGSVVFPFTQFYPVTARVQWNSANGNLQRFIPSPGFTSLIEDKGVGYAG